MLQGLPVRFDDQLTVLIEYFLSIRDLGNDGTGGPVFVSEGRAGYRNDDQPTCSQSLQDHLQSLLKNSRVSLLQSGSTVDSEKRPEARELAACTRDVCLTLSTDSSIQGSIPIPSYRVWHWVYE